MTHAIRDALAERIGPFPAEGPRGEGLLPTRYEDVTQDGRVGLRPMSHAIGRAVWQPLLVRSPLAEPFARDGIVPILARLVIVAGGGPIAVSAPCRARGTFALRRAVDASGTTRFSVDMWADVEGPLGHTWGPPPPGAGTALALGRVYGEHVLTRPFGPPERRKVTALPEPMPTSERPWAEPEALFALPEGAAWLGEEHVRPPVVLGLGHTDSNQHVNSLVYPLLLEEAALRLGGGGLGLGVLAPVERFVDYGEFRYRKPFFASQACQITLRPYRRTEGEARFGVVARFAPPRDSDPQRAHVYAHLELVP